MINKIFISVLVTTCLACYSTMASAVEPPIEVSIYNLTDAPIHYFFTNKGHETIEGIIEPKKNQPQTLKMIDPEKNVASSAELMITDLKGHRLNEYHFWFTHEEGFYGSRLIYLDPRYDISGYIPPYTWNFEYFFKMK